MKYLTISFPNTMSLGHLSLEDRVDVVSGGYHSQGRIISKTEGIPSRPAFAEAQVKVNEPGGRSNPDKPSEPIILSNPEKASEPEVTRNPIKESEPPNTSNPEPESEPVRKSNPESRSDNRGTQEGRPPLLGGG